MIQLKNEFINYLSKLKFSQKTISDYVSRVNWVCRTENFKNWDEIQSSLYGLIVKYQKKNQRCVLPLKKLNGFLLEASFESSSYCSYDSYSKNIMCFLTRSFDPETGEIRISDPDDKYKDYATETELAVFLGVDQRTLKRWRQKRIGPDWEKIGGKIHYPLIYLAEYLKKQKNK